MWHDKQLYKKFCKIQIILKFIDITLNIKRLIQLLHLKFQKNK